DAAVQYEGGVVQYLHVRDLHALHAPEHDESPSMGSRTTRAPACAARGTRGEPARSRSREWLEAYAFATGMQSRWRRSCGAAVPVAASSAARRRTTSSWHPLATGRAVR